MTRTVRIPQTASKKPSTTTVDTGSGSTLEVFVADDDLNQQLLFVMAAEKCNFSIEFTFVDSGDELLMVLNHRIEFGQLPDLIIINLNNDGRCTLGQLQMHSSLWQIPLLGLIPRDERITPPSSTTAHWCAAWPEEFDDLVGLVDTLPSRAGRTGFTVHLDHIDLTEHPSFN